MRPYCHPSNELKLICNSAQLLIYQKPNHRRTENDFTDQESPRAEGESQLVYLRVSLRVSFAGLRPLRAFILQGLIRKSLNIETTSQKLIHLSAGRQENTVNEALVVGCIEYS